MTIDPRLKERRRAVAEARARHSVRRLLRFLVLLGVMGAAVWFLFSPWMRVVQVRTSGIVVSDAYSVLATHRVVAGTPMILLRPSRVEEALKEDPWVRTARVHRQWPNEVIVQIEERKPAAWVETSSGWVRRAVDGVALPSPVEPDDSLSWIRLPGIGDAEGMTSPWVRGALEFVFTLDEVGGVTAEVWREGGELWADVEGFQVRLGLPGEMEAKALSLLALLSEPIPEGSILILVAPAHPAVSPPVPPEEAGNSKGEVEP